MVLGGARRLLLGALVCALTTAACTQRPPQDVAGDPTPRATAPPASAAGDVRLSLERAFALRAHLLVGDAASSDLRRNADTIVDAVSAAGANGIGRALAAHAEAVAAGDVRDASSALTSALDDAIGPEADAEATAALVKAATRSLVSARDAAADDRHDEAFAAARDAFAEMVDVGRALAASVADRAPRDYPGPRSSGPLELQSALQQLLGEHTLLTAVVTRRGAAGARNFEAAAAALNGNTEDLVRALRSTYGTRVDDFERAWRQRISTLADYTVAAARDDQDERKQLQEQLRRSDRAVAAALVALTRDAADRKQVAGTLRRMTNAMVRQIDEWIAGRAALADREQRRAYEHSTSLADVLATAIAADRPEEFADDS